MFRGVVALGFLLHSSEAAMKIVVNSMEPGHKDIVNKMLQDYNIHPGHVYEHAFSGFAADIPDALAGFLTTLPEVELIEDDFTIRPLELYNLDRIDQRSNQLDDNYVAPNTGDNADVWILDTGINKNHQDFTGRIRNVMDFTGTPFINYLGEDNNGHGTHCASTMGGTVYGVAKQVNIHSGKVLTDAGAGSGSLAAIDFVIGWHKGEVFSDFPKQTNTPTIMSMSLGGQKSESSNTAVANALRAGVISVVAAGNDNVDAKDTSPASAPAAITVGATDESTGKAEYSNFGPVVDIFAPGSGILAARHDSDTNAKSLQGTSMACPHVAGAMAVFVTAHPNLSASRAIDQLLEQSTKGAIRNLPKHTANKLLFIGDARGVSGDAPNSNPTQNGDEPSVSEPEGDFFGVAQAGLKVGATVSDSTTTLHGGVISFGLSGAGYDNLPGGKP